MKSEFIQNILSDISESIKTDTFIDVENSKIELKDLSSGNEWNSLYETICAYLNTNGGYVICGIRERNKKYNLSGFNRDNEPKLIEIHSKFFKNDNGVLIDLSNNIYFEYITLLGKEILIILVTPLSDDLKYVTYKGKYFERQLTQDREIPLSKINIQKEYKIEIEYAKELTFVDGATLSDLSIDKVNNYITLLNKEIKKETLKADLLQAKSFLARQHFLKDDKVTVLGLLVCGDDPFHYLENRVEVDTYYDTSSNISSDKKIFRNDIISLMEDAFRYVWSNIKIGRTVKQGGQEQPEYPEEVIRETINNALAHRDYTVNNFITITVEPNQYIEIKNPGTFKEKIKFTNTSTDTPIKRLIPGIPESKNPKLASILKVFDKIESQGRGMASLINDSLNNLIDLPYYELKGGIIKLRIPSGKLVDEEINSWIDGFRNYIISKLKSKITEEHKAILAFFYKSEQLNKRDFYTIMLSESNNHFAIIHELKSAKLIYKHESSTTDYTIYVLDKILTKVNFNDELIDLIGDEFIDYDDTVKEMLNLTYLHTKFNKKSLKASEMIAEIYRRLYGKIIIPKTYESLNRKIRLNCTRLKTKGLFIEDKMKSKSYYLNSNFNKEQDLFFTNA